MRGPIPAVLGPTASGKSETAMHLARLWGAEILSVDSVQVYRGMDIGSAKPSAAEQAEIPHHMIDLVPPEVDYTAADFQRAGRRVMADARRRGVPLVMAGGSGLHFRALVDPFEFPPGGDPEVRAAVDRLPPEAAAAELLAADPEAGEHVDMANPRRVQRAVEIIRLGGETPSRRAAGESAAGVRSYRAEVPFAAAGVDPGAKLAERVEGRIDRMLEAGLLEEAAGLDGRMGRNAAQAVGYRQLIPVVRGEISLEQGRADAVRATMDLAKRQRTYFRRDPRIRWLDWDDDPDARRRAARRMLEGMLEEMKPWTS